MTWLTTSHGFIKYGGRYWKLIGWDFGKSTYGDLEVVTKIVKMTCYSMISVEIDIHTYLIIKGNDRNFYYFLHNIMTNERRVVSLPWIQKLLPL